jgi:hypothetical protein
MKPGRTLPPLLLGLALLLPGLAGAQASDEPLLAADMSRVDRPFSAATPLPRSLPTTTFTHGRVRGPFEQVYPRRW